MRLERQLVLNRFLQSLFRAESLEDIKTRLQNVPEGFAGDGHSHFFHALEMVWKGDVQTLAEYDARVLEHQARLAHHRGSSFSFRYFQYLALVYSEVYLDRLTADPVTLCAEMNAFLKDVREGGEVAADFSDYQIGDLRRLGFFMATGSGKTLLMHVHIRQVLHYLAHGAHPEALVDRPDGRRAFDNVLLITPGEGLSRQHLDEFTLSGITASHLTQAGAWRASLGSWFSGETVRVIEIHKLADEAVGEGESVPVDALGPHNLVLVDEGHKGTGSEAQVWKNRQKALCDKGLLLEYSATFAQAIAAAPGRRAQEAMAIEYGRSILFDYSYRYFYQDGFGKDFRVQNLASGTDAHADMLLAGGMLTFYQQLKLYREQRDAYRTYNLSKPLWIFIGHRVTRGASRDDKTTLSDVATVVQFLGRFASDPEWAVDLVRAVLEGRSGLPGQEEGTDLFSGAFPGLEGLDAGELHRDLTDTVFHGRGDIEVVDLKGADGELGLRVSGSRDGRYFGVVNIGDVAGFRKGLTDIDVREDALTGSLFRRIEDTDSHVNILVGARKFIEGWSSWRVSTMGLLNMGRGEGPQIIQLFGRGVRLKGKGFCLKRSKALAGEEHPEGIEQLETLEIFGLRADYVRKFRELIETEESAELPFFVETRANVKLEQLELTVPDLDRAYQFSDDTVVLEAAPHYSPVINLAPVVHTGGGVVIDTRTEGDRLILQAAQLDILDWKALYADVVEHKRLKGYSNLLVTPDALRDVLRPADPCYTLIARERDLQRPEALQRATTLILKRFVDRFYAASERQAEHRHLKPVGVRETHASYVSRYEIHVRENCTDLLEKVRKWISSDDKFKSGDKPLPRLHMDKHLYSPLFLELPTDKKDKVRVLPTPLVESERSFLIGLQKFWEKAHRQAPFKDWEVFVLRNLPGVGVGFHRHSGFYPDFIVWVRKPDRVRVVFVEPHGMRMEDDLGGNDKVALLKDIKALSDEPTFQSAGMELDGYIITGTPWRDIRGAAAFGSADKLASECHVLTSERDKEANLNCVLGVT